MDIGRGLGAPFRDDAWLAKAALGGVWAVIPFTGFALFGYYLDYTRNVAHGRETPLPEWNMFGRYWVRGVLATIAVLIYQLPALLLFAIGVAPAILANAIDGGTGSDVAGALGAGTMCLVFMVAVVYAIAVSILVFAALVNYALYEEFAALFAFSEIRARLSSNAGYFTAWVMYLVIAIVSSIIGGTIGGVLVFIPVLGWIASVFLSGAIGFVGSLMGAHIFGQYAARAYGLPGPPAAASVAAQPAPYSAPPPPPAAPAPPAPPPPPAPPAAPETPSGPHSDDEQP